MGSTLMGSTTPKESINLLSPQQQKLFSSTLSEQGPQYQQALGNFLQPQGIEDYQNLFQQSYIDPALQALNQQILPQIQQSFGDLNAGSSSALNQALAQAATDVSTSLGSQMGNFMQGQQANQLSALGLFQPMLSQPMQQPVMQQQQGLAGPLLQTLGMLGGGYIMSTREAKEKVEDFDKGLELVRTMKSKKYDYKPENGGEKNRIGFIAEELPEDIVREKEGKLHVDLYGMLTLAVNSIQELDKRLEKLESKNG